VVSHLADSNTVTVLDLVHDKTYKFHQKDLVRFNGVDADAFALAQLDDNQFVIASIEGFHGDPESKSTLSFFVAFVDGDKQWLPYSSDISTTEAFEFYCNQNRFLSIALLSAKEIQSQRSSVLKGPVDASLLHKVLYLNLRIWGWEWYASLAKSKLSDIHSRNYYVKAVVKSVNQKKKSYTISVPELNTSFDVNNWFMFRHGDETASLSGDSNTVVSAAYLSEHGVHFER